jgi:hypothetical protein
LIRSGFLMVAMLLLDAPSGDLFRFRHFGLDPESRRTHPPYWNFRQRLGKGSLRRPITLLDLLPVEWVNSVDFLSVVGRLYRRGDSGEAPWAHPVPGGTHPRGGESSGILSTHSIGRRATLLRVKGPGRNAGLKLRAVSEKKGFCALLFLVFHS